MASCSICSKDAPSLAGCPDCEADDMCVQCFLFEHVKEHGGYAAWTDDQRGKDFSEDED